MFSPITIYSQGKTDIYVPGFSRGIKPVLGVEKLVYHRCIINKINMVVPLAFWTEELASWRSGGSSKSITPVNHWPFKADPSSALFFCPAFQATQTCCNKVGYIRDSHLRANLPLCDNGNHALSCRDFHCSYTRIVKD